ncbi:MAG: M23 family metallopeptidase [Solirubrobacterales bacterium]
MRRALPPVLVLALASALATSALAGGTGGIGTGGEGSGTGDTTTEDHVFPVPAKHTYGDGYGAGRGHEGQDIFARCGKRILAARRGRVKYRGRQAAAGNYVVINGAGTPRDYAYLHLQSKAFVKVGQRVRTGELIGRVGDTGNSSGCHLHSELWRGDWNGRPDVTRKLRAWDKYS